jgi:oligopeptide/dipeptide ABC transporter ATP-binding protein
MTVRFLADRVAVMYLGRIVEEGPTELVFSDPKHPYTRALLDSAPTLDKLMTLPEALPGELPDPRMRFKGCRFASRCPSVADICREQDPPKVEENGRTYYSFFPVSAPPTPPAAPKEG